MFRKLLLATVLSTAFVGAASASPISGSFSLQSFSGTYIGGANPTAMNATGLDFGTVFGGSGNGYGTNGSALVGNGTGSFAGLTGTTASIADIALGAFANPYTTNPFVTFSTGSLTLSFLNAAISRLPTSLTVSGSGTFSDGNPADTSTGIFSLSTNSQGGDPNNVQFTFTSNASVTAVPEPASMALLGAGLVGIGAMRRRSAQG